jgi:hypothetical protein
MEEVTTTFPTRSLQVIEYQIGITSGFSPAHTTYGLIEGVQF